MPVHELPLHTVFGPVLCVDFWIRGDNAGITVLVESQFPSHAGRLIRVWVNISHNTHQLAHLEGRNIVNRAAPAPIGYKLPPAGTKPLKPVQLRNRWFAL